MSALINYGRALRAAMTGNKVFSVPRISTTSYVLLKAGMN